ncbi:unnamed protein product [Pedinophyceae sp. YPF-701]|nr:unnamed protein product [Pedinophyceae sp. YPF-701]
MDVSGIARGCGPAGQAGGVGTLRSMATEQGGPTLARASQESWPSRDAAGSARPGDAPGQVSGDPFAPVREEITSISERTRHNVTTDIPALQDAASYFFLPEARGKGLRPGLVLLMSSALRDMPEPKAYYEVDTSPHNSYTEDIRRRQQRIGEIAEMIHVASLLHDDVIDEADTRRGRKTVNAAFGNKAAILGGDFLLARASVALAALRETRVVGMLSRVIEDLVTGEVMQLTAQPDDLLSIDYYLQKTHRKTASLLANACQAAALLGLHSVDEIKLAYEYGRHLGLAFQIVDDILDFEQQEADLGKPNLADLKSGVATVPVLYALEEHPQLASMIQGRFKGDGEVEQAVRLIQDSAGVERARDLARRHAHAASALITELPPASHGYTMQCRKALFELPRRVIERTR